MGRCRGEADQGGRPLSRVPQPVSLFRVRRGAMVSLPWVGGGAATAAQGEDAVHAGRQVQGDPAVRGAGLGEDELLARTHVDAGVTGGVQDRGGARGGPAQVQPGAEPRPYAPQFARGVLRRKGREQDEPARGGLDERLDHGGRERVGRVRVVHVAGRIVRAHQRVVEEVPAQYRVQAPPTPVPGPAAGPPSAHDGGARAPSRSRPAQFQGAVGRGRQLRGCRRG